MALTSSKLIGIPTFKSVPALSIANVKENIELYLKDGDKYSYMKDAIKYSPSHPSNVNGYWWVNSEDLTETIRTEQWFNRKSKNICIEFIFIRHYHTTDSLCPLYFSEWYTKVICSNKFGDEIEIYKSDAQLKRFIQVIGNQ